ncbi:hypothetical protein [Paraburkholderia oxyphila]|uniref:hypothetical protein n=1 Tax=Paraburkholderia oxyphila TaxID=614212 RepID=UPI0004853C11|nr:hypothetical protein [Paraburkholderia oxyphila]
MSTYFTEAASAEAVNARVGEQSDPRLREVMAALVRHLPAFVRATSAWKAARRNGARNSISC